MGTSPSTGTFDIFRVSLLSSSPARAKSRNHESFEFHAVGEIDRRDFRLELETNVIFIDDGWFKVQTDAVFLELNCHSSSAAATAAATLNNGNRKLTAREEACGLSIHRDQVRLSQCTECAVGLHRANHLCGVAAHQEHVRGGGKGPRQYAFSCITE